MSTGYQMPQRKPEKLIECPKCQHFPFRSFLRGQVQRSKRVWFILWKRPYCAVICSQCKEIVDYEYL